MIVQCNKDFEKLKEVSKSGIVKPIAIKLNFEYAMQDCVIQTLEGLHNVPVGSVIMTGLEGERYAMSEESFLNKYTDIIYSDQQKNSGVASKKINPDLEYIYLHPSIAFSAKMWNGMFEASIGDYLIKYGDNDFGIIKPNLFYKLYQLQ
jgi:hypothetical protein